MFKYSLSLVFRRKLRTFLTSLGITISVILLSSIIFGMQGLRNVITGELEARFKPTQIIVSMQDFLSFGGPSSDKEKKKEPEFITPTVLKQIESQPNIAKAFPMTNLLQFEISIEGEEEAAYSPAYLAGIKTLEGTGMFLDFKGEDMTPEKNEIFVGNYVTDYYGLSPEEVIGKKLIMQPATDSFFTQRSAGLLNAKYEFVIAGFIDSGADRTDGIINLDRSLEILAVSSGFQNSKDYLNTFGYDQIFLEMNDEENVPKMVKYLEDEFGLSAITSEDILTLVDQVTVVLTLSLTLFGLISAFVASIGIINTMVMSIYEQTKEIGIIKAIGASNKQVLAIFLIQAGTIGLIGGLNGILVTTLLMFGLNPVIVDLLKEEGLTADTFFTLDPMVIAGIILISILIGMVAGIYPAMKAARLDPVKALRYE